MATAAETGPLTGQQTLDSARLEQLLGQSVTGMGAAMNGVLVLIGAELVLWPALKGADPLTAAEIAERTGVPALYMNQWPAAQAASGKVDYDAGTHVHPVAGAGARPRRREQPVYLVGGYHIVASVYRDRDRIAEALRSGRGFGWHEHDPELFRGTEQEVAAGPGAQAGEKRLREMAEGAGATRFRRATETHFTVVLEARPRFFTALLNAPTGEAVQAGAGEAVGAGDAGDRATQAMWMPEPTAGLPCPEAGRKARMWTVAGT